MYIVESLGAQAPDLDLDDIAKIILTNKKGSATAFEDVKYLNTNPIIRNTIPSLEFDVEVKMRDLSEIDEEIRSNRPVIAWVTLSDNVHSCGHAIVIKGLDRDNNWIYYNDPIFGEQKEELTSFLARWESQDRLLIKIKIGQGIQKLLDEYKENNVIEMGGERKT
jgi:hypothetical protein